MGEGVLVVVLMVLVVVLVVLRVVLGLVEAVAKPRLLPVLRKPPTGPPKPPPAPAGGSIGVVVLVVLGVVLRQCSEQMFGTDSVRNSVPSQLRKHVKSGLIVCGFRFAHFFCLFVGFFVLLGLFWLQVCANRPKCVQ